MMERTRKKLTVTRTVRPSQEINLSSQMVRKASKPKVPDKKKHDGTETFISTGSTLLDLAISGGRVRGGGIPGGILVEIFGPSGTGKTVLLCEIAGAIQRQGGEIKFKDPEARLNKQFAQIFDLDLEDEDYDTPDLIPDVFGSVRKWAPKNPNKINGVFADSLAALSTNLEMDSEDGDKMGMRRAKEFSEECRRTCRILTQNNILMVCSNQVRVNTDAGPYGQKYRAPGGEAIPFYASLRLRCMGASKITQKKKINEKEVTRVIGVETPIEVFKSSVWKPYRTASVFIMFDYGIDDIRANLQFVKQMTKATTYVVEEEKAGASMQDAIAYVEKHGLENDLRGQTIDLWEAVEEEFETTRKPKAR
jgi:RecA/RadA recombinase